MKDYGFMHSSHFTTAAVIEATRLGLPSMKEYLDQRLKHIEHSFDSKTHNQIKKSCKKENFAMGEYGSLLTEIWVPEHKIKDQLFDKSKPMQPMTM